MNSSRKLLMFAISMIFFVFGITSVFSNDKLDLTELRYLDDKDIEERKLGEEKLGGGEGELYNCTDDTCEIKNTNCSGTTPDAQGVYHNCACNKTHTSAIDKDSTSKKCIFTQKKQLTAFLLELFVGFGAGHFYRHHYLMASLKLVAFVFGIYVICLFPLTAKCVTDCCDSDCLVVLVSILFYLYALGLAFWYIWDLVYFGKNKYPDLTHGEKIKFLPW
jgi:uncharacterized membrane protein (Fun14 family)